MHQHAGAGLFRGVGSRNYSSDSLLTVVDQGICSPPSVFVVFTFILSSVVPTPSLRMRSRTFMTAQYPTAATAADGGRVALSIGRAWRGRPVAGHGRMGNESRLDRHWGRPMKIDELAA